MMRTRLRDAPDDTELAAMYPTPHDHTIYGYGHHLRVKHTIALGLWLFWHNGEHRSIGDLSTGDAAIPKGIAADGTRLVLGDYAPGYPITGPVEQTLDQIDPVDMFVCSETIEHVDDPDLLLQRIATKARSLLLSTPIGECDHGNPEHLWGWDQEAMTAMLERAGWRIVAHVDVLLPDTYSYMIFAATKEHDA